MLASTLFVRVVPQDKDRGFMLLAGYDASVIQRTALQYATLSNPSRASLAAAIERMRVNNSAKEVKDVTAPAIQKRLEKIFEEQATPVLVKTGMALPATFAGMGIGQYLPKV